MIRNLSKFGTRYLAGLPEPWHYLFTGKYDRKSHARWARRPRWRILLEIFAALVVYAAVLFILAFITWVAATSISPPAP